MSPHSSAFPPIGQSIIVLPTVDSSNNYAMGQVKAGLAGHGTLYFALEQTAGKGQRGRAWITGRGENIAASVILRPPEAIGSNPFPLSTAVSLSCYDLFKKFVEPEDLKIKWPNDLYWQDRKAGGILIENAFRGSKWEWSVAGIGLNINQTRFDGLSTRAVSLLQITGKRQDIFALGRQLAAQLEERFRALLNNSFPALHEEYDSLLFRKDSWTTLKSGNSSSLMKVLGTTRSGLLKVKDESGKERQFHSGEIEWYLE